MSTSPSSPAATQPNLPPPTAKMPNETVRALVTLFILFHLFGVALALTWNPNAPALLSPPVVDIDSPNDSKLFLALKSTPVLAQYMYALCLDTPHDYWLSYGDSTDDDHTVDLTLTYPDGHTEARQFPPADSHGEQRLRYKALVRTLAMQFYEDAPDKTLLTKISENLLEQNGAKEVRVQIRRHQPLSMEEARADDPGLHDPNNARTFANVYAGDITLNSLGQGEVHDLGEAKRDVAPVTGPRGRSRLQNPPAGDSSSTDTPPGPPGGKSGSSSTNTNRKLPLPLNGDGNDLTLPPEKPN
ncbi:MAG TPA: hypothetical protein VFE46_16225 [Pirellulales bacterium]|jgi:hypothetical protein|nr:hypothetical protein [Pirellulales bacterium]